jgi:hypothetical protein
MTPSVTPKMGSGEQNLQTGPGAVGRAENRSGCANMKTGPGALGTVEKGSRSAIPEDWI